MTTIDSTALAKAFTAYGAVSSHDASSAGLPVAITAYLAALPSPKVEAEPVEGFVFVPIEPTQSMMDAGLYQASRDATWADVYSQWKDMVEAAKNGGALATPSPVLADEGVTVYRDIFAEITAKATALEFDPKDPERIVAYRVPVGPIHRAAGKLGFQMFDGEAHLSAAVKDARDLAIAFEEYKRAMNEEVIPQIEEAIRKRQTLAATPPAVTP